MTLELVFGALAPALGEQIRNAGLYADIEALARFQRDADALSHLVVRGLLSDSAVAAARRKLMKKIIGIVGSSSTGSKDVG